MINLTSFTLPSKEWLLINLNVETMSGKSSYLGMWEDTLDFSPLSLAALGTTTLTHLALVHVSWTLVVVREGDEVGHHTENAVREEFLVSGDSRHHL